MRRPEQFAFILALAAGSALPAALKAHPAPEQIAGLHSDAPSVHSEVTPVRGIALLMGSTADTVLSLLGPASLDRSAGPTARHLQFGSGPCILDVYFYEQAPGAPPSVHYVEARYADGRDADADACIDARLSGTASTKQPATRP